MNKEEYDRFVEELVNAERAPVHSFDARDPKVYEGCMPIEVLASRGHDAIRFGPMKPVGLRDPHTGHRPWAVLQLRTENRERTLFNLVGFQTNLKFGEQKRVFGMIPGLAHAEFIRYGVMHRNRADHRSGRVYGIRFFRHFSRDQPGPQAGRKGNPAAAGNHHDGRPFPVYFRV